MWRRKLTCNHWLRFITWNRHSSFSESPQKNQQGSFSWLCLLDSTRHKTNTTNWSGGSDKLNKAHTRAPVGAKEKKTATGERWNWTTGFFEFPYGFEVRTPEPLEIIHPRHTKSSAPDRAAWFGQEFHLQSMWIAPTIDKGQPTREETGVLMEQAARTDCSWSSGPSMVVQTSRFEIGSDFEKCFIWRIFLCLTGKATKKCLFQRFRKKFSALPPYGAQNNQFNSMPKTTLLFFSKTLKTLFLQHFFGTCRTRVPHWKV